MTHIIIEGNLIQLGLKRWEADDIFSQQASIIKGGIIPFKKLRLPLYSLLN